MAGRTLDRRPKSGRIDTSAGRSAESSTMERRALRHVPGLERPAFQWALLFLCLVLCALGAWSAIRIRVLRSQLGTLQAALLVAERRQDDLERQLARERAAREALAIGLERERAASERGKPIVPAFTLTPGLSRSGVPEQKLSVSSDAMAVRLELVTELRPGRTYRVGVVPFSGGEELWSHARVRPRTARAPVVVIIPAEILVPGWYALALTTADASGRREEAGTYAFEVIRP